MKLENVQKYVYELITKKLKFEINSENQTFDEIGCDLLSIFDIIENIETKFNIMLDDSVIDNNTTINDFIKIVYENVKLFK